MLGKTNSLFGNSSAFPLRLTRISLTAGILSRFGSYGVTLTAVVDATSPQDAMKKGHDKLEKLSMSAKAEKLGVDELQDSDDEGKPSVKMTSKPISFTDMKKF